MSWTLKAWWGHRRGSSPPVEETFDTKAEGQARAAEILADGYTDDSPGKHLHYPAAAVRFIGLIEDEE